MVDKDRTIKKAIRKYGSIFPVTGKRTLDECFIFLRGDGFFQFRTKDKKVHSMRAFLLRQEIEVVHFNREMVFSFIKLINRPILIRSLFRKKQRYTGILPLCNGMELRRLLQV